eukprot:1545848-Pyramimonas_sp.AAC.1
MAPTLVLSELQVLARPRLMLMPFSAPGPRRVPTEWSPGRARRDLQYRCAFFAVRTPMRFAVKSQSLLAGHSLLAFSAVSTARQIFARASPLVPARWSLLLKAVVKSSSLGVSSTAASSKARRSPRVPAHCWPSGTRCSTAARNPLPFTAARAMHKAALGRQCLPRRPRRAATRVVWASVSPRLKW